MILQKTTAKPKKEETKRVFPLRYVILLHSIGIGIMLWFYLAHRSQAVILPSSQIKGHEGQENMILVRTSDYKLIRPLVLEDIAAESEQLSGLKHDVSALITSEEKKGHVIAASVYVRKLNDGSWISINGQESYKPGSILKLSVMLYYLKLAEQNPGMLAAEFAYDRPIPNPRNETFKEKQIELGKKYKVKDLLEAMIVNSDNIATSLLMLHIEKPALYEKIFHDLGLQIPDTFSNSYTLNAMQCSKFLRVLYSSTYLKQQYSEFAMELLSRSNFREGIVKSLPKNVMVAHKFGEAGGDSLPELSETGVVYTGDDTYLLTVMTKGKNAQEQAEAISEISRLVYDKIKE